MTCWPIVRTTSPERSRVTWRLSRDIALVELRLLRPWRRKTCPRSRASPFPASTSFVTLDRSGNAVACALTMDNLFGTGRILPGLGFLAAASPTAVPPPLLSAGLVWNDKIKAFRAAVGGSGQEGAPLAVALALINTLRTKQPLSVPVPDPGRANVIACGRYLPGDNSECRWANDPAQIRVGYGGQLSRLALSFRSACRSRGRSAGRRTSEDRLRSRTSRRLGSGARLERACYWQQ